MSSVPTTTPSGHLTAAGELIAIAIMCGTIFALCAAWLTWDWIIQHRRTRKGP